MVDTLSRSADAPPRSFAIPAVIVGSKSTCSSIAVRAFHAGSDMVVTGVSILLPTYNERENLPLIVYLIDK
jgi:hypothetical protein